MDECVGNEATAVCDYIPLVTAKLSKKDLFSHATGPRGHPRAPVKITTADIRVTQHLVGLTVCSRSSSTFYRRLVKESQYRYHHHQTVFDIIHIPTQTIAMSFVRPMSPMDLLRFNPCNLDHLTETYNIGFYLEYFTKWPSLCKVVESETGEIEAYSMLFHSDKK